MIQKGKIKMRCWQCGDNVKTRRQCYCSNACKQKAYRERQKAKKNALKNTMHMEDRITLAQVVKQRPDFKDQFAGFLKDFGVPASVEMLHIVANQIGIGQHS